MLLSVWVGCFRCIIQMTSVNANGHWAQTISLIWLYAHNPIFHLSSHTGCLKPSSYNLIFSILDWSNIWSQWETSSFLKLGTQCTTFIRLYLIRSESENHGKMLFFWMCSYRKQSVSVTQRTAHGMEQKVHSVHLLWSVLLHAAGTGPLSSILVHEYWEKYPEYPPYQM